MLGEFVHQMDQLARRAAADQPVMVDSAHPRAVIAAVFHPPQTIDQPVRDLILADDADYAAHVPMPLL